MQHECENKGRIHITHTYVVPGIGRTASGKCLACGKRVSIVTFVVGEADGRGDGAAALAARMREGRARPELKETCDVPDQA